jgi:hypothetical protein
VTRRDKVCATGRRAQTLNATEAALAWQILAKKMEGMERRDMPKFNDLLRAIRESTISGKYLRGEPELNDKHHRSH